MNKKIVPVLIILVLIAVGGAGYFMGQQSNAPVDPADAVSAENLTHKAENTSTEATAESTPAEEDYILSYEDLTDYHKDYF